MYIVLAVLAMLLLLLLLGVKPLRLLKGLGCAVLERYRRDGLCDSLGSSSVRDIGLLVRPCLGLVGTILGLRLWGRRRRLDNRRGRLVVLLWLLRLSLLLLLPIRSIAVVCIQLSLVSGASGGSGSGSLLLSCL